MLENDPDRVSSSADRGTQLGAGTHVLTRVLTVVLWPLVVLQRITNEIGRLLSGVAASIGAVLRRISEDLLRPIRAMLEPVVRAGRRFGLLVRRVGGDLAVLLLRAVFVVFGPLVVAGRWLGFVLRRFGAWFAGLIRRAILDPLAEMGRLLGLVLRRVLTVVLLPLVALCRLLGGIGRVLWLAAAWVKAGLRRVTQWVLAPIRAVLARLGRTGRWLGVVLLRSAGWFAGLVRHSVLVRVIARHRRLALVVLLITTAAMTAAADAQLLLLWLPVLLAALAREPVIALLHRIAEWITRVGQRAAHSIHVASVKATFQATRSLYTPVLGPVGPQLSTASAELSLPFHVTVYQNEYLHQDDVEVNAIITVTAAEGAGSANGTQRSTPEAAEVILLDCSGSMAYPLAKLRAAQGATAAAIDSLREGTWFALVRAAEDAELVYPPGGGLAQASPDTRKAAKRALRLMWPEGGTAMGQWLILARELLASRPSAIAHAILLTDGRNESESHDAMQSALAACSGRFQCDCRGVGTDWEVSELRAIASQLLGTVDIIAEPTDLEADFRSMMKAAMAKRVGGIALRVWSPRGATGRFLKQVSPTIEDLTSRAVSVDALTVDYPTGAWGDESRDYHLCVRVPSKEIGEEMLAARVSVVVGGNTASQALVRAVWTDDEQLSTRINREVAHYTGQAELADAIQEGLEARKSGDEDTATFKLGRAVALATAAGNTATMKLLSGVVDVQDPLTGTVRLKRRIEDADEMALDTRSTRTIRVQKHQP